MRLLFRASGRIRAFTRVGIRDRGFFLLLLVSYIVSRTAGGSLPSLVFYFLAAVALVCLVWTRAIHFNLNVIHEFERYRTARGQPVAVSLKVENEGFLPVPWMRTVDATGGPPGAFSETGSLRSLASMVRSYSIDDLPRGRYRPGPVTITAGDPLGLFETRGHHRWYRELVVYPRVHRWPEISVPLRQPFGRIRTGDRSHEDPSSLAGLRDFRPGDNPRHIDWKATARRGLLHVRQFELTATGSLHVVLDLWQGQEPGPFELAVEAAASLAAAALGRGLELSLLARGRSTRHLPPGRGRGQLRACLELLATVEPDSQAPLSGVLARARGTRPGATLCVVTSHLDGPAAGQLVTRRGNAPAAVFLAGGTTPPGTSRRLAAIGISVLRVSPDGMPYPEEGSLHAVTR